MSLSRFCSVLLTLLPIAATAQVVLPDAPFGATDSGPPTSRPLQTATSLLTSPSSSATIDTYLSHCFPALEADARPHGDVTVALSLGADGLQSSPLQLISPEPGKATVEQLRQFLRVEVALLGCPPLPIDTAATLHLATQGDTLISTLVKVEEPDWLAGLDDAIVSSAVEPFVPADPDTVQDTVATDQGQKTLPADPAPVESVVAQEQPATDPEPETQVAALPGATSGPSPEPEGTANTPEFIPDDPLFQITAPTTATADPNPAEIIVGPDGTPSSETTQLAALPQASTTPDTAPFIQGEAAPNTDPAAEGDNDPAAAPAYQTDEEVLALTRSKRREVQTRLRLAGFSPGRADGLLGPRSRQAILDWQADSGLPQTGFLNAQQLDRLITETAEAYRNRPRNRVARNRNYVGAFGCLRRPDGRIVLFRSPQCDLRSLLERR